MKSVKTCVTGTVKTLLCVFIIQMSIIPGLSMEKSQDLKSKIAELEHKLWNEGQIDMIDSFYHKDCIIHLGSLLTLKGSDTMKQMISTFQDKIENRVYILEEMILEDNRLVERYSWTGIVKGTEKSVSVIGCVVYHFEKGKIIEVWNFEDMLGLYQQLGFAPPTAFNN